MRYVCDCDDIKKADMGRGKFQFVEVDEDEICKNCGHYAMAFRNISVDKRGRISPHYELQNLHGEVTNEAKRKANENGHMYWENQDLQEFLQNWSTGKSFDELSAEWLNRRKALQSSLAKD